MVCSRYVDRLQELIDYLTRNVPSDMIMPCSENSKAPRFSHSNNTWSWLKAGWHINNNISLGSSPDIGILLRRICVVDVDDVETANELEKDFPFLAMTPREMTKRGVHYFFFRSVLADNVGYFDGSGQVTKGIDFKTVCSSGTSGFIVVSPSNGKDWVSTPWNCDTPMTVIPDDLLQRVAVRRYSSVPKTVRAKGEGLLIPECNPMLRFSYIKTFLEMDSDILLPESFSSDIVRDVINSYQWSSTPIFTYKGVRSYYTLKQHLIRMVEFCDFIGMPSDHLDCLVRTGKEVVVNTLVNPLLAKSLTNGACVDVPVKCKLVVERLSGVFFESSKVFSRYVLMDRKEGSLCIQQNPSACISRCLPDNLKDIMTEHPGKVMVAGGFVLSVVTTGVDLNASDIDVYIITDDIEEASSILAKFKTPGNSAFVTGNAITLTNEGNLDQLPIQVILFLAPTYSDVLMNFDIEPCKVGAYICPETGDIRVISSAQWLRSIQTKAFPLHSRRWTASSTYRALKYAMKGYQPYIAGLNRDFARLNGLSDSPTLRSMRGQTGVMELLYADGALDSQQDCLEGSILSKLSSNMRGKGRVSDYASSLTRGVLSRAMTTFTWFFNTIAVWVSRKTERDRVLAHMTVTQDKRVIWRPKPKYCDHFSSYPLPMNIDLVVPEEALE